MSDSKTPASIELRLWELNGVVIECYHYSSGFVEPLLKHSHDEYQFGLSFDCEGEYHYREQLHYIPTVMSPREMAKAVMFLASDDASSVTGMDLDVTGGQLAR